jgi:putative FmdB family regulatory protein
MPIYEYVCAACGHRLDAWQKMSDPLLSECPACHGSSLQKQMSAAGISVRNGHTAPAPACGAGACPACRVD